MGTPEEPARRSPHLLDVGESLAPIAVCSDTGMLLFATPPALASLKKLAGVDDTPSPLPTDLWRVLEGTEPGELVEWRPHGPRGDALGCARYVASQGSYLLLLKEVSTRHAALTESLHRQKLEHTERLVASIAHDIRGSVASIVYSADFLSVGGPGVRGEILSDTLHDICEASRRLQLTVDALLDYARLGTSILVPVPLKETLTRAQALLRSHYRDGAHRLRIDVAPQAEWVRGNPIVVEQIFVNLLLNSAEASQKPRSVVVTAYPTVVHGARAGGPPFHVCVKVWDDGPGIAVGLREFVFDPFFTTKQQRTGLGLAIARQAAEGMEGSLALDDDETGTCFVLHLPGCEAVR